MIVSISLDNGLSVGVCCAAAFFLSLASFLFILTNPPASLSILEGLTHLSLPEMSGHLFKAQAQVPGTF